MNCRQVPHVPNAEQSILCSCLLGSADEVCELLRPNDFFVKAHQIIFAAVDDLQAKAQPVDLPSVAEHLRASNNLEGIGGATYLAKLTDTVPLAANIAHYCSLIERAATLRRALSNCNCMIEQIYDGADIETVSAALQQASREIDSGKGPHLASYRDLAETMPEKWEKLGSELGVTGISSGLSAIDRMTGGFQSTDLIILAARPAMGKTALGLTLAEGAATDGFPTLFVSLEMSKGQLYCRQTSKTARIDGQKLRLGGITHHEWKRILDSQDRLQHLPIYIDDTPHKHYTEIMRRIRRAAKEHGIKLVIIDYLQLIRGDNSQRKDLEIGDITGALKGLAKELDIPVIMLSQLNRGVETRDNKRPRLSDLRESGAIEQDADIVLFIYRDEYYYPEKTDQIGIAEIDFAKHRNGPTGIVKLRWTGWRSMFEDL